MKSEWLQYTILRVASLLAPSDQRAAWVKEWQSELWYIPRRGATLFCLGAFRDANWLRRNNPSPVTRTLGRLESPMQCLTFLATLAAVSIFLAARLPLGREIVLPSSLANGTSVLGCIAMTLFSRLLPTATATRVMGNRQPMPWASRLRRWIFLALKIALVLPVMPCGLIVLALTGAVPLATLGLFATWIMAFRWVLMDQRRRCPVCLRLLTNPVRIGSPSQTFLEWYGTESMCSRGHGLLQVPEISATCHGKPQWLHLDCSWNDLFSHAARMR